MNKNKSNSLATALTKHFYVQQQLRL